MSEIYLVRHAVSYANTGESTAFGNENAPLTDYGIRQAEGLRVRLIERFGIDPTLYDQPILCSEFTRTQQTARIAGFANLEINGIINEAEFDRREMGPKEAVRKHVQELWAPDETNARTTQCIEMIRRGELRHKFFFGHGLWFASFIMKLKSEAQILGKPFNYEFDEDKGYIPRTTSVTVAEV
jgi:broad specificity phosphatase PhoE